MKFTFALNNKDYTLCRAFSWGNFVGHCKKASEGSLKNRVVHAIIACAELLPIVSQIASLIEYLIIHSFSKQNNPGPIQKDIKRQTADPIAPAVKDLIFPNTTIPPNLQEPLSLRLSLKREIVNNLETTFSTEQKEKIAEIYLDFLHHFAEFLVELHEKNLDVLFYDYQIEASKEKDYFQKLAALSPKSLFYWNYWSKRPEELIKKFHETIGRSGDTVPLFPNLPFIRHDDFDEGKMQAALFDDGISYFQWITHTHHAEVQGFYVYGDKAPYPEYIET